MSRSAGPILLVLACLLAPALSFAWGPTGHRVVGRIADDHVAPETREAIHALVGPTGLAPVSTWADEIRSDPAYTGGVKGRPDTRPWHYINATDSDDYGRSLIGYRGQPRHLIDAITHHEAILSDATASVDARRDALKWLVHLYGDLHQPLHVGLAKDKGGNTVQVEWFGQRSNLHRVWDSGFLDRDRLSFTEVVQFIGQPTADEVAEAQKGGLHEWALEAIAMRPLVYDLPAAKGKRGIRLGYRYFDRHRRVVHRQLLKAGLRLAGRLDALLGAAR